MHILLESKSHHDHHHTSVRRSIHEERAPGGSGSNRQVWLDNKHALYVSDDFDSIDDLTFTNHFVTKMTKGPGLFECHLSSRGNNT